MRQEKAASYAAKAVGSLFRSILSQADSLRAYLRGQMPSEEYHRVHSLVCASGEVRRAYFSSRWHGLGPHIYFHTCYTCYYITSILYYIIITIIISIKRT